MFKPTRIVVTEGRFVSELGRESGEISGIRAAGASSVLYWHSAQRVVCRPTVMGPTSLPQILQVAMDGKDHAIELRVSGI